MKSPLSLDIQLPGRTVGYISDPQIVRCLKHLAKGTVVIAPSSSTARKTKRSTPSICIGSFCRPFTCRIVVYPTLSHLSIPLPSLLQGVRWKHSYGTTAVVGP